MNDISVAVEGLTRTFGGFVAVKGIDLSVHKGEIFGFLGANGAGKTTTIRMLCGLLIPTAGRGTVAGFSIINQTELIKTRIGYMSQKFSLYDDLTAEENIDFFGGMYGLSAKRLALKKEEIIATAGLGHMRKRSTGELPGGWKQRLALGTALINDPEIIFLDEPTAGVDPVSRRDFWNVIQDIAEKGVTVFVTTHYLDEAEYCNTISLMDSGQIVAVGTPAELKEKSITGHMYLVETKDLATSMRILSEKDYGIRASVLGVRLTITTALREKEAEKTLRRLLKSGGVELISFEPKEPTLEDVFIELIGREQ